MRKFLAVSALPPNVFVVPGILEMAVWFLPPLRCFCYSKPAGIPLAFSSTTIAKF